MKVADSPMMKKCNKIFQNIQKLPAAMTKNDFHGHEKELEKLSDKFEEADSSPLTIWNKWYCATGDAKIKAVSGKFFLLNQNFRNYLEYLIEKLENENEKIIVFAHHRAVIDSLEQNISPKIKGNLIKITGSTKSEDRQILVDLFQQKETIRCALLSITAVNMGKNMIDGLKNIHFIFRSYINKSIDSRFRRASLHARCDGSSRRSSAQNWTRDRC